MVPHKDIGMNFHIKPVGHLSQGLKKHFSILIAIEDLLSFISSRQDMV